MKLPAFDYHAPGSLDEAIALLASSGGTARPLAGGQSFLPIMAFRLANPSALVDLRRIPDLDGIEISAEEVRLGAMVRWHAKVACRNVDPSSLTGSSKRPSRWMSTPCAMARGTP